MGFSRLCFYSDSGEFLSATAEDREDRVFNDGHKDTGEFTSPTVACRLVASCVLVLHRIDLP